MLNRLRTRFMLLTLIPVIGGVVGTTAISLRSYLRDKADFVHELGSIAAPTIAQTIQLKLKSIEEQLVLMGSLPKLIPGVLGIRVDSPKAKSVGNLISIAIPTHLPALFANENRIYFATQITGLPIILELETNLFSNSFDLARSLGVVVFGSTGTPVAAREESKVDHLAISRLLLDGNRFPDHQELVARSVTLSEKGGVEYLVAAAPILTANLGYVMVYSPATQVRVLALQILKDSVPFILILLITTSVAGIWFSARLVQPIEKLTQATARIASGDWHFDLNIQSADEIGKLSQAFQLMAVELDHREIALKQAQEQIVRNERLAVLGKFSAGVAHEVKNPLNSVLGYAQLLQRKKSDTMDEQQKNYLQFIMDETRRASKIITELLTFARQKPPTLKSISVDDLVTRTVELLKPQSQLSKVDLVANIKLPGLKVKADSEQLYQAFSNLITNAFHALEGKPEGTRTVTLSANQAGEYVQFEISDNGSGISPENMKRLFEPFFSTKEIGKGTGLGLALVHGIVDQHSGKIEVQSELGVGTTFSIQIPNGLTD